MKPLQYHLLALMTAFCMMALSFAMVLHLSEVAIETELSALWNFFAIVLTLTGILVSPVAALGAVVGLVSELTAPIVKEKRKRHQ